MLLARRIDTLSDVHAPLSTSLNDVSAGQPARCPSGKGDIPTNGRIDARDSEEGRIVGAT
jgi:hypothetical protein